MCARYPPIHLFFFCLCNHSLSKHLDWFQLSFPFLLGRWLESAKSSMGIRGGLSKCFGWEAAFRCILKFPRPVWGQRWLVYIRTEIETPTRRMSEMYDLFFFIFAGENMPVEGMKPCFSYCCTYNVCLSFGSFFFIYPYPRKHFNASLCVFSPVILVLTLWFNVCSPVCLMHTGTRLVRPSCTHPLTHILHRHPHTNRSVCSHIPAGSSATHTSTHFDDR